MASSVIFSPTKAFEEAFESPNLGGAVFVVLLSSLFLGLAAFWGSAVLMAGFYFFIANIVQWFILSVFVWFFELINVKKRKALVGTSFSKILSVVGKLWAINLVGSFLLVSMVLLIKNISFGLFKIVGLVGVILTLVLVIAWIVASYKMLGVVINKKGFPLLVNWVLLNIINGFVATFILLIVTKVLALI